MIMLSGCSDNRPRTENPRGSCQSLSDAFSRPIRANNHGGLNPENPAAAMQADLETSDLRLLRILVENMDRSMDPTHKNDVLREELVVTRALTELDDTLQYIRKDTSILFQEILSQAITG